MAGKKRKARPSEPEPSAAPLIEIQPPPLEEVEAEPEEQVREIQIEAEPEQQQQQTIEEEHELEQEEEDPAEKMEDNDNGGEQEEAPEAAGEAIKTEQDANGGVKGEKEEKEEEEEEELEEEPVEKILEPFGKEQLVVLVKEAVSKHPELMELLHKLATRTPPTARSSSTARLGHHCRNPNQRLREHRRGARKALKQPQKNIGDRVTSCQLASAGPVPAPPPTASPVSEYTQRKIFVSNVSAEVDIQKLVEFFSKFGEIEDGPLGLDKQTGKPKGFCLFVYKSVEGAKKALEEPHKNFDAAPALSPALGQALTALLASQGAGLGLNNLLGGLGASMSQGVPQVMNNPGGYGNQAGASYGNQQVMQGGYQNPQMGQGGAGRTQPGGGAPYMGHGH
ncbi:hypothetical protein C3L33_06007, partial [Rhododendron williamsianum]